MIMMRNSVFKQTAPAPKESRRSSLNHHELSVNTFHSFQCWAENASLRNQKADYRRKCKGSDNRRRVGHLYVSWMTVLGGRVGKTSCAQVSPCKYGSTLSLLTTQYLVHLMSGSMHGRACLTRQGKSLSAETRSRDQEEKPRISVHNSRAIIYTKAEAASALFTFAHCFPLSLFCASAHSLSIASSTLGA